MFKVNVVSKDAPNFKQQFLMLGFQTKLLSIMTFHYISKNYNIKFVNQMT